MDEKEVAPNYTGGIKELEETQRILKDRLILIGDNLIRIKENTQEEILNLKLEVDKLKDALNKIKSFLESFSSGIDNFAKKNEVDILRKQAKMFQPLEFVRREEFEKIKKELKLN